MELVEAGLDPPRRPVGVQALPVLPALQVEGGYQMSFGWTKAAPAGARQLPTPRWPTVAVKASDTTPLDGMVTDFATRTAVLNRRFWEAAG